MPFDPRDLAPLIGGLGGATGGGNGFMRGWARAQQEAEARKQQEQQQAMQQEQLGFQRERLDMERATQDRLSEQQRMQYTQQLQLLFTNPEVDPDVALQLATLSPPAGYDVGAIQSMANKIFTPDEKTRRAAAKRLKEIESDPQVKRLIAAGENLDATAWEASALGGNPEDPEGAPRYTYAQLKQRAQRPTPSAPLPKVTSAQTGAGSDYAQALTRYARGLNKTPDQLSSDEELRFRRRYSDAALSQAPTVSRQEDAAVSKGVADAIARGEQPPTLTGMRQYTATVRAELAKQGYDLTAATQDWNAMSRHLTTLNSATQVRMRQATNFALESLTLADGLITEWEGGPFPALNKARLAAAKQGALGPEAQKIATELDGLFTDLVAELAVVYRGGLSPTDESIRLASDNLQSNWSAPVARNMLNLLRKELRIRLNSIETTGVAGTPGNIYERPGERLDPETGDVTPAPGTAPPRVREPRQRVPNPFRRN